jgi:Sulfotransferase family
VPVPTKSRVIFIGGLGRSGSTLVERLLGQIDGMHAMGETVHLWARSIGDDERCGCGRPFSECEFWPRVGDEAFGGWSSVDVARVERLRAAVDRMRHVPAVVTTRMSDELRSYTDYYVKLYAGVHAVGGATWLVDSSKHPSMAHCLRKRSDDIELRVVHVVRDPRAVAHSWTKRVERPDVTSGRGDAELMTRYSPARAALLWNGENVAIESLRRLDVPVHRVRYEDLVEDPEQVLRAIVRFAGLPDATTLPVHGDLATLAATHTASGNPMRFTTGPLTIRSDDRWRADMSAVDRRKVTAITWPLARAYGYSDRRHAA